MSCNCNNNLSEKTAPPTGATVKTKPAKSGLGKTIVSKKDYLTTIGSVLCSLPLLTFK